MSLVWVWQKPRDVVAACGTPGSVVHHPGLCSPGSCWHTACMELLPACSCCRGTPTPLLPGQLGGGEPGAGGVGELASLVTRSQEEGWEGINKWGWGHGMMLSRVGVQRRAAAQMHRSVSRACGGGSEGGVAMQMRQLNAEQPGRGDC